MRIGLTSLAAVLVQALGAILAFVVQLIFARMLGSSEYGVFAFYFALAVIVGTWGRVGSDVAVLRLGGEAFHSDSRQLRAVVAHARSVTLVGAMTGGASVALVMLAVGTKGPHVTALLLACSLALPLALNGVLQAGLLAAGKAAIGLLPEMLLRPTVALIVLACAIRCAEAAASAAIAMGAMLAAALASMAVLAIASNQLSPVGTPVPVSSQDKRRWTRLGFSLMVVNATYLLVYNADTILLGFWLRPEAIGPYQIAKQISQLGLFAMVAVQFVFGPHMSGLAATQDWPKLRRLFLSITLLGTVFAVMVLAIFGLGGRWMLTLFGQAYASAYELALILLAAQVVVATLGPVGVLASMSGHHRLAAAAYGGGALLMFGAGPALVDAWGPTGAAVGQGLIAVMCAVSISIGVVHRTPLLRRQSGT